MAVAAEAEHPTAAEVGPVQAVQLHRCRVAGTERAWVTLEQGPPAGVLLEGLLPLHDASWFLRPREALREEGQEVPKEGKHQEEAGSLGLGAGHIQEALLLPWVAVGAHQEAGRHSQAGREGAEEQPPPGAGRTREASEEPRIRGEEQEGPRTQEASPRAARKHLGEAQEEREELPKLVVAVGTHRAVGRHSEAAQQGSRAGVVASDLAFAYRVLLLAVVSALAPPVSRLQDADSSETSRSRRCSSSC